MKGGAVRHDGLGLWLAVRHADADAVLRERRLGRIFREREPADVWETFNWLHADSILDCEPPKHTRLRALVAKAFAAATSSVCGHGCASWPTGCSTTPSPRPARTALSTSSPTTPSPCR